MDSIMGILSNLKDSSRLKIDMRLDNFKKEEFDKEYIMEYVNDISLEEELANDLLNF